MAYFFKAIPRTTEQLVALKKFLEEASIPYSQIPAAPSELSPVCVNPLLHVDTPSTLFVPTTEFKHFVGNERLTRHGNLCFQDLLSRLVLYTKTNKLLTHDQTGFYLDSTLQELLKTTANKIDWIDVHMHCMLLLTRVAVA